MPSSQSDSPSPSIEFGVFPGFLVRNGKGSSSILRSWRQVWVKVAGGGVIIVGCLFYGRWCYCPSMNFPHCVLSLVSSLDFW